MSEEAKWYVLYIGNPKKVERLRETIEASTGDCTVWVPTHRVLVSKRGKVTPIDKPLFQGYVFAKFFYKDSSIESSISLNCGGVLLKLPGAEQPYEVTAEEIQHIRQSSFEHEQTESTAEQYGLYIGQKVEITTGQLMGTRGRVIEIRKDKVLVDVPFMGRSVQAQVDPSTCIACKHQDDEEA